MNDEVCGASTGMCGARDEVCGAPTETCPACDCGDCRLRAAVAALLAHVPESLSRWQQIGGVMVPVQLITELRRAAEADGIGVER